jgi:hypothetical protein
MLALLRVLPNPARAVTTLLELLLRHPVTGGEIFDLQIVAAMLNNNIRRIYTFNLGNFEVFRELIVTVPDLLQGRGIWNRPLLTTNSGHPDFSLQTAEV